MVGDRCASWCRSALPSAPAIPSSSANAGSERRNLSFVIPGRREAASPESRDSPMCNSTSEVWSFGPSRNDIAKLLLQMLRQEIKAARPGDIRTGLVVAWPLVAVEAVLGARIDVDLDFGPLGADGLDIAERNAGVLFAEMQLGRHFRLFVGGTNEGGALITESPRHA